MGIPKLISTLEPFAQRVVLGQFKEKGRFSKREGREDGPRPTIWFVAIDGPSLVYHIYHILCSRAPDSAQPWNSQPSYEEINQGVLSFVRYLKDRLGMDILKVYFDGGLPSSKRPTRMERLERGRKQLEALRIEHGDPFSADNIFSGMESLLSSCNGSRKGKSGEGDPREIFEPSGPAPSRYKNLPAPPFMVPACIEFLRKELDNVKRERAPGYERIGEHYDTQGPYSIVEQVDGEAGVYCAALAANTGASILTSDSDLIAHKLGTRGAVILLSSLELSTIESSSETTLSSTAPRETLTGLMYRPSDLTVRLGIPDHSHQLFCFYRFRNPEMRTNQIRMFCNNSLKSPELKEAFQDFLLRYNTTKIQNTIHKSYFGSNPGDLPHDLDPRLSELYLQLKEPSNEEQDLFMYFPTLIEDSRRDSAWSYGEDIRMLAYTFLGQERDKDKESRRGNTVLEVRRRGFQIGSVSTPAQLSQDSVDDQTKTIIASYQPLKALDALVSQRPSPAKIWKTFAFSEMNKKRSMRGKAEASTAWFSEYVRPDKFLCRPQSWDNIHSQATLNAILYSLRMLKQALQLRSKASGWDEEPESTKGLADILASLPSIPDLMAPEAPEIEEPKSAHETNRQLTIQTKSQGQITAPPVNGTSNDQHQPTASNKKRKRQGKVSKKMAQKRRNWQRRHHDGYHV